MEKYIFYVIMPVLMILLYQTIPVEWKKKGRKKFFYIYAGIAIISSYVMISVSLLTQNELIRNVFSKGTLFFAIFSSSALVIFCIRYMLCLIAIQIQDYRMAGILSSKTFYITSTSIMTAFLLIAGTIHFNAIQIVTYDVNVSDEIKTNVSQCKVGVIADVHLGCGASKADVDRMCEKLNEQNYDLICIVGDIADMTTYESDLRYFSEKIASVKTTYGIYAVEGNHEKDSLLPTRAILKEYGIDGLYDEAVTLENGVTLVGRADKSELAVTDLLKEKKVSEDDAVIVMQHIPKNFLEMENENWLILCGHTHGYQIPIYGLINPFISEVPYGYVEKNNLQVITTSGVSAWGFRVKWPSYNEIATVRFVF